MNLEQQNLNKNEVKITPKKLEDIITFIKPTDEEIKYNKQLGEATNLFLAGKKDEAIRLNNEARSIRPEEKIFTDEDKEKFISMRGELAKQLGYTIIENEGKHFSLRKGDFNVSMFHDMSPSILGYENGRILQTTITNINNTDEFEFNNGKITESKNKEIKKIFDEIVNYFN